MGKDLGMIGGFDPVKAERDYLSKENAELIEFLESLKTRVSSFHNVVMLSMRGDRSRYDSGDTRSVLTVLSMLSVDMLRDIEITLADSEGDELPF
jgi:hypothetical protein